MTYEYLITKPTFNAPVAGIDAFYNDRDDTLTLFIDGSRFTLHSQQAWDLLGSIERELHGADYDRKDD